MNTRGNHSLHELFLVWDLPSRRPSAGFQGTHASSYSLDSSSWCLYFLHQCVSYLMLLYSAHVLNKCCHIHVPGRKYKYAPNKWYALNNQSLWYYHWHIQRM